MDMVKKTASIEETDHRVLASITAMSFFVSSRALTVPQNLASFSSCETPIQLRR